MSTVNEQSMDSRPTSSRGSSRTRRFNPTGRTSLHWDSLRRDHELWQEDGDCFVHFYARGSSQRGPSLKIPFAAVQASRSSYLLDTCLTVKNDRPRAIDSDSSDSGYESPLQSSRRFELYLPASADLTRDQTYTYHVTTRNYFAYLTGKQALVGEKLGTALADLWDRVKAWEHGNDSTTKLLEFCEMQGYMHLAENTQYATAVLNLAERARLRDLWVHAFVHCVGMHDRLDWSPEFDSLSNVTKAMVKRASLEMDLHIARVIRAFGGFLEEALGAEHLGLSKASREHLDRFRSFLHGHYLEQLGYFPPSTSDPFDKDLWMNMYQDFHALYKYLVDVDSVDDMASVLNTSGGVCVFQNVRAFDLRHGYDPLPHPQPLLPQAEAPRRIIDAQRTLRTFKLGRSDAAPAAKPKTTPKLALATATNILDERLMALPIIQDYQRFERQKLEDKVLPAEARKVRWLLIYGVLQMLISITRAPPEVKDVEAASYPLCVLTTGGPPWDVDEEDVPERSSTAPTTPQGLAPASDESERVSIHPDCEADNAEDYFSLSRKNSGMALDKMAPPPLRITVPVSRRMSIRSGMNSSVSALQRSVTGSFARKNSNRKSVQASPITPPRKTTSSYCEIMVEGYGNGMSTEDEDASSELAMPLEELHVRRRPSNAFADFDFGLGNVPEDDVLTTPHEVRHARGESDSQIPMFAIEPILEDSQLDAAPFPRDSYVSTDTTSSASSISNAESTAPSEVCSSTRSSYAPTCDTDLTAPMFATQTTLDLDRKLSAVHSRHRMTTRSTREESQSSFGVSTVCSSLSVGCYAPRGLPVSVYKPSGMPTERVAAAPAVSSFAMETGRRSSSVDSHASSQYPDASLQADEIAEEELRGRRRSRAMDGLKKFSFNL
nr:hypothetical protein B0A51_18540 [Rachicladosporium sp. CCFEE 5018]OQO24534.1 hypothetical protein B0A51_06783 [Rachicladosporium sp. CCFEE 5018]